jgi:hypothetical protein
MVLNGETTLVLEQGRPITGILDAREVASSDNYRSQMLIIHLLPLFIPSNWNDEAKPALRKLTLAGIVQHNQMTNNAAPRV